MSSNASDGVGPVVALREAAAAWRTGGDKRRPAVLDALAGLDAVLGPHLEREETEAMPVTSRAITQRQWDQAHNVKSKKPAQLGFEGRWLVDDVDPVRRQTVLHEVPLVPRYLLLWGFGPRYRRRKAILWPRAAA